MKFFTFVVFCSAMIFMTQEAQGKVFEKCELARVLKSSGISAFMMKNLGDWDCLVKHESGYNTRAMNTQNSDGSIDYGLFQINGRYWCTVGQRGGGCNMDCNKLLDDDIRDDMECASKIYNTKCKAHHGFNAWVAWTNRCQGRSLSVSECFSEF